MFSYLNTLLRKNERLYGAEARAVRIIIQMRDVCGGDNEGCSGNSKRWLNLGCILKVEPARFAH